MSDILLKVMLAFAVVAVIGYPFVRVWSAGEADDDFLELNEESEILYRRKETAYAALKELEFDYRIGALSERDYRELEAKYKLEAIEAISAVEERETDEQAFAAAGQQECPACGQEYEPGVRFCSVCGERLPEDGGGRRAKEVTAKTRPSCCPDCGSPIESSYHFCVVCGMEVVR
jgi:DNA-directed RNA polymerase subunit RPC12/RpoP